jgi:hypothetical protein
MFDPVPWAVSAQGAEHSPEVLRNMLAISTLRAKGIIGTPDLLVTATPTPSTSVRIAPGAGLVQMGSTQAAAQSYSFRAGTSTDLPISPTGSAGGRSDLIVARIEDPGVAGTPWTASATPKVGPYVFPRVLSNVPPGATTLADAGRAGDSAIVLARIDLPANTGTVTDAMIVDLRKMALPRHISESNGNQNSTVDTLTSDSWIVWPPYGPSVEVPEWATHVNLQCTLSGIRGVGNVDGEMALRMVDGSGNVYLNQQAQKYDIDIGASGGGAVRFVVNLNVYGPISAARGLRLYQQVRSHRLQARPDRGDINVDTGSTILYRCDFYERPMRP